MLQQLLQEHSKQNIVAIANSIGNSKVDIQQIVGLIVKDEQPLSPRASWVFSELCKAGNEYISEHLPLLIRALPTITIDGIKRNILCGLQKQTIADDDLGLLLDMCFKFILAPNETVAVKVYAMQLIANAASKYPVLKQELIAVVEEEMNKNTIAFYARAKRVLKQVDKKYNLEQLKNSIPKH